MSAIFGVFHPSQPTRNDLIAIRTAQAERPVTYQEIGRTLDTLPDGYHHLHSERVMSSGPESASPDDLFTYGCEAIRTWTAQAALNLVLEPTVPKFEEGEILVFALPMKPSPFWTTGACRILRIVDEPDRYGFVYGTLPHHPEIGEEAFLVHRNDNGKVWCSITAFSRGGSLPMRLSGPIGRVIQRRASEVYLDGYEKFIAERLSAQTAQS
jgi:uncharacterized protein (UPF0548 family)